MRSPRRIFSLLIVLAAIFALSACGSSSSSSDVGSAQQVLSQTFGAGKPFKSGKLNATLQINAKGLAAISGPINVTLTGPFQSNGPKTFPSFDFGLSLNVAGAAFTAGAVSTGTAGYVKLEGTTYKLSDKFVSSVLGAVKHAVKPSAKSQSGISLQSLGIDPRRWLSSPQKVGTEKVGETDATHVTAQVDVPKLLDDVDTLLGKATKLAPSGSAIGVPTGLSAALRSQIEQAVKSATLDVWSGVGDGTLRRLLVKVGFVLPKSAQRSFGGLQQGNISLDVVLSDLNLQQTITAPSGAHPMSELTAQLGQLFGGLTGGTPSPNKSSGSGTTAPSSKYLTCLASAGADVKKVQACADLLAK